jgi:hypothetical protein
MMAAAEPTDRALKGWQPPVWAEMLTAPAARYVTPFCEMALPDAQSREWYRVVTGKEPG